MNPPDYKTCREEERWRYVAWRLEGAGIRSVFVGGTVVSIYTGGLYRSGNLDMIWAAFKQAVLVSRRQKSRIDFKKVAAWCQKEGGFSASEELIQSFAGPELPA